MFGILGDKPQRTRSGDAPDDDNTSILPTHYQSYQKSTTAKSCQDAIDASQSADCKHFNSRECINFATTIATVSTFALAMTTLYNKFPADNNNIATISSSSSAATFVLGSTGLVPPYVARGIPSSPSLGKTFDSDPAPFSLLTPAELGIDTHSRSEDSKPGAVFGSWRHGPPAVAELGDDRRTNTKTNADTSNEQDWTDGSSVPNYFIAQEKDRTAMPTNAWYQNLLIGTVNDGHLTPNNRAYTIPYILDFVGPIPGVRIQFPHVLAGDTIVQMATVERHGLTLGTMSDGSVHTAYVVDEDSPPSQLGLGLKWSKKCKGSADHPCPTMKTQVIRGIPYITMHYSAGIKPVVASELPLIRTPFIDGEAIAEEDFVCGDLDEEQEGDEDRKSSPSSFHVNKEVSLSFKESDMTWLLFFSRPARVACFQAKTDEDAEPLPPGVVDFSTKKAFELRVVDDDSPLIIRAALENNCTYGGNSLFCVGAQPREETHLGDLLRAHADVYPHNPSIKYDFPSTAVEGKETGYASIIFNWGARSMRDQTRLVSTPGVDPGAAESQDLLMYALPHHTDSIARVIAAEAGGTGYCSESLHGAACLLRGNEWIMVEDLDGPPSFVALRPPHHNIIPSLAKAISADINFDLPENYMAGAGDTYFSGKMLAKLGRIIVIASELRGLAETPESNAYDLDDPSERELRRIVQECKKADLPSDKMIESAIARLRSGVEVWLNGTAQAKFVYDRAWGGLVNCGCLFNDETQRCDNEFPNCPTFADPGLNFGNGFYNDHHFHYGYHIYAAAVVANYDMSWGRKYWEEVLLLVRDIANPSVHDKFFPAFRHKDWFLGSSWASGIATLGGQPYPNGRNQESSSEAIHSYEAIALFGSVMMHAWGDGTAENNVLNEKAETARRVSLMGRLLTATEVRSAQRYWHVLHGDSATNTIYPKQYKPPVVGMMWQTMAQFQTWFGNAPFLACGIQLMPLTSISERRDTVNWLQQLYFPFAESCESNQMCTDQGWSVLEYAVLAAVGHRDLAAEKTTALPLSVFESAGGNGHSLTNSLWYIATRPDVDEPLRLEHMKTKEQQKPEEPHEPSYEPEPKQITCECEDTCTKKQLNADAGGYSCLQRIQWLQEAFGKTEVAACRQVGGKEFAIECGSCDPDRCAPPAPPRPKSSKEMELDEVCPPCSSIVCQSEANRCPRSLLAPFLCLSGGNAGGCSQTPWSVACTECCRLTEKCFG